MAGVIYNEGVAILLALFRHKHIECSLKLIDLADYKKGIQIDTEAEIHAVSFSSLQFPLAKMFIKSLTDKKPEGAIIVGGIHATVSPESCLEIPHIDAVVAGEGENFITWLIENWPCSLEKCTLPNIYPKGRPFTPLQRCDYVGLNTLPYPDRSSFNKESLRRAPEFILSRGCPFSCSYCANEYLNGIYGCRIRRKSPEYAIAELHDAFRIIDIPENRIITFHDDVFLLDIEWLSLFSQLYKKDFKNPFRCNTTASAVTDENVKILKEMNCAEVWIGIESGDEQYRKKILKKNISDEQIAKAFNTVHKYDLKAVSFNIMGCPGETVKDIKKTMELNRRCRVFHTSCSLFVPFPGTSLYEQEKAKNNIRELSIEEADLGAGISGLKNKPVSDREYVMYLKLLPLYSQGNWLLYFIVLIAGNLGILQVLLPILKKFKYLIKRYFKIQKIDKIDFDRTG